MSEKETMQEPTREQDESGKELSDEALGRVSGGRENPDADDIRRRRDEWRRHGLPLSDLCPRHLDGPDYPGCTNYCELNETRHHSDGQPGFDYYRYCLLYDMPVWPLHELQWG